MIEGDEKQFSQYDSTSPPDNLSKYPDLQRARDLFIELLSSDRPLRNLGYNAKQTQVAKPILMLTQEEGQVKSVGGGSYT